MISLYGLEGLGVGGIGLGCRGLGFRVKHSIGLFSRKLRRQECSDAASGGVFAVRTP